MNYSLQQIINALTNLHLNDGDKDGVLNKLKEAHDLLQSALDDMDGLSAQGRQVIDTLLGCMMAIDAIIGNKRGGDENGR